MGKLETSLKFALFWCQEVVIGAALGSLTLSHKYVQENNGLLSVPLWCEHPPPQICKLCIFEVINNYYKIIVFLLSQIAMAQWWLWTFFVFTLIIWVKLFFLVLLNRNFVSKDPAVLRVPLQFLFTIKKFCR